MNLSDCCRGGDGCCMTVSARFLSGSFAFSIPFISGSNYYKSREVFGSLRVYCIFRFCISFILLLLFHS